MAETRTLTRADTALDTPWNVLVHNDPVNLMSYVTWVLMKLFGYSRSKASALMKEVHETGRSIVWSGGREQAEHYVHRLQAHQLQSSLEKAA